MTILTNRRSVMTLFTNELCPYCHCVRIVLAEKGVTFEAEELSLANEAEKLLELNPYGTLPTLVDRDLVLYSAPIILEYLEERFPHPPLMPVYPVAKGRSRLMLYRVERDWYSLLNIITSNTQSDSNKEKAKADLLDSILAVAPVFSSYKFFLSDEFTLVDCSLAALLWRLPSLGIQIPKQGKPVIDYAKSLFDRDSFQASLSEAEQELQSANEEQ